MNTVIKGFKYRIYPNKEQEIQLNKTFGCVRFVYNQMLAKKINLYKSGGKSINKTNCNNYCNRELKKEYPWLKEVDKFALTNSIYDLDNAYKNFFREIKQGNKNQGFPKFKSKKNHYCSYTTNFTNNNIKVDFENNKVQLPKLKWIKAKLHREFKGKILFATISKTPSGKYFVSFNVECEHQELKQNNNKIAIDLGIKDLLITSNGELYNPNGICDYYSIGGIWEDSLMTKDGVMCDFEMIEKIDFKGMEDNCHNISYIVSSVITPDGEYHSRAFHEDEFEANFYNDFIKKYNKEGYAIAILDCHR